MRNEDERQMIRRDARWRLGASIAMLLVGCAILVDPRIGKGFGHWESLIVGIVLGGSLYGFWISFSLYRKAHN